MNNSGVTQLEFNQAMSDFKHMFPEMGEDVIEAVLRANNGVVDATIDQLLQINIESQKDKSTSSKPNVNPYERNIFVDGPSNFDPSNNKNYKKDFPFSKKQNFEKENTSNIINYNYNYSSNNSNSKLIKEALKSRLDLPIWDELAPDFLRITLNENQRKMTCLNHPDANLMSSSFLQQKMEENKRNRQITSINDDPEMAQYLEDERFAILLQNEEFVRELRMNQDFMATLESDYNHNARINPESTSTLPNDSDADFKEKLRNMGKVSKKKFTQLARLFSGRMRKNFKQLDNQSTSREQYIYQDLSNDNYEDIATVTVSGSSGSTTTSTYTMATNSDFSKI